MYVLLPNSKCFKANGQSFKGFSRPSSTPLDHTDEREARANLAEFLFLPVNKSAGYIYNDDCKTNQDCFVAKADMRYTTTSEKSPLFKINDILIQHCAAAAETTAGLLQPFFDENLKIDSTKARYNTRSLSGCFCRITRPTGVIERYRVLDKKVQIIE